jgi:aldehyde dehydrogenase (NAD+)
MNLKGQYGNFIDGKWVEPLTGQYGQNINPADEDDVIGEFPLSGSEDVAKAVNAAAKAFSSWKSLTPARRESYLERFTALIAEQRMSIGRAICREEGKTLAEALGEPDRGVEECRFFMGESRRLEGITLPSDRPGVVSIATRVPIGVVATITPWNFPFLTPLRKIIPAIAMGNTVVFKPASDTPHSAVLIMELFEHAGLPPGVVNLVIGQGSDLGDALSSHPLVNGISFTGSTAVGRRINQASAPHFAKVQLEMGGKNPCIVAGYRNLESAASQIVQSAFAVAGQRCTAISRVIVLRDQAEELESRMLAAMKSIVLGNGMDPKVTMGPVINYKAGQGIIEHIEAAKVAGARIASGGSRARGKGLDKGFYIEPTLVTQVRPEMRIAREEVFGPVLAMIEVDSFEEAMIVANDTKYGLTASLFSDDLGKIHIFQRDIESGMTHVNHGTITDSYMPFGGIKESGLGPFSKGSTNKDFFTTLKVNYTRLA